MSNTQNDDTRTEDARDDACCSAMTIIKLLAVNAPIEILRKELANLTRLVEQSAGG